MSGHGNYVELRTQSLRGGWRRLARRAAFWKPAPQPVIVPAAADTFTDTGPLSVHDTVPANDRRWERVWMPGIPGVGAAADVPINPPIPVSHRSVVFLRVDVFAADTGDAIAVYQRVGDEFVLRGRVPTITDTEQDNP